MAAPATTSSIGGFGSDIIDGGELTARNAIDYRSGTSGVFRRRDEPGVRRSDATTATVTKTDGIDTLQNINQFFGTALRRQLQPRGHQRHRALDLSWCAAAPATTRSPATARNGWSPTTTAATSAITVNLATGTASDGQGGTDSLVNVRAVLVLVRRQRHASPAAAATTPSSSPVTGNKVLVGGGGHDTWRYQGTANV